MTETPTNRAPRIGRETKPSAQIPIYAWVSLVAFLCFLVVFVLLLNNIDKLSQFGLLEPVYYLVLILMGVTAVAFLFGALQSRATWAGRVLGGTLHLSGPIAGAALVVIGGYYFRPKTASFPLTVYVHGDAGQQDMVLRNTGRVLLKLGPEISGEQIGESGQAVFPRIPGEFRGQRVPAWVDSDDYEASDPTVTLAGGDIELIVRHRVKHFRLSGYVMDEKGRPMPGVHLSLPAYQLEYTTLSNGRFEFEVVADREKMVDLIAEEEGYQTMRLSPTLGDLDVDFSLKRK